MARRTIQQTLELGVSRNLIEIKEDRIHYLIQNKEYNFNDPEEPVRAGIYIELVEEYNYSPYLIDFEVSVPRRTPNDFADIVVFKDEEHLENYLVVEAKEENRSETQWQQDIEQGFGNANGLRSEFLIVDKFNERKVYDIQSHPQNEREKNQISDISVNFGLTPTYLYGSGTGEGLKSVPFNDLSRIFQKCHNILWSGGKLNPIVAFDEMSKLFFAKIYDERNTPNNHYYKFQVGQNENEVIVAQRILDIYDEAKSLDPYVFIDPIKITDDKIQQVVRVLHSISLIETDIDAKGQAFEKFLGVVFRGELGQYFTRRQIVEFAVEMLDPTENDIILDPSCGSGGFLLYSLKNVIEKIKDQYSGNDSLISRKIYDYTRQKVYGIEISSEIARVAMMDMIVNEDGHSNIECNTGLNNQFNNPNIGYNRFSLILTNPPFGVKIKKNDRDNLGHNSFDNFEFGGNKKSQLSDILFLDQYRKLLYNSANKNPRAGIVLQTGVLNNPSNKSLLDWLRKHFKILAVISMPDFAFRKAGSGMKTCLLFLNKYETPYAEVSDIEDYNVFMAIANKIGYDSTLRPDANDLPQILTHYQNQTENPENGIYLKNFHDLDYRLDPTYYHNKRIIKETLDSYEENGHKIYPLSNLLVLKNSGKSPEGGVTRSTGEIPSITITNIMRDGSLDFSDCLNFVPEDFYNDFGESKGHLELNDILIAKDGATTGKATIIDQNFPFMDDSTNPSSPKAIFSEHIFRLRFKDGINPGFINAFLNSWFGQLQLETITSGGAQGGITREFTDNIFVPIVEPDFQVEVENEWQEGFQEARSLITRYKTTVEEIKHRVSDSLLSKPPLNDESLISIIEDSDSEDE